MQPSPDPAEAVARKWLVNLNEALVQRWIRCRRYQEYYEGRHRLIFASEKFKSAFGKLFSEYADNFCDIVVDAVVERLTVQGFRLEREASSDDDAWAMWQANNLDADSEIAHAEALICEETYALVDVPAPGEHWPTITVEHPSQVIVAFAPGSRRNRAAALKRWVDDDGNLRANVYLPDMVYKYKAAGDGAVFQGWVLGGTTFPAATELQWEPYTVAGEIQHFANPLRVVPIVPLRNKPRLLTVAESELKKVIPVQDAINVLVLDMLVGADAAAIPARWMAGVPLETDPKTNEILPPPNVEKTKLFQAENPEARFGAFPETNLAAYVKAIELQVQHLAWQARLPQHYFSQSGQAPSGDAIKSSETGLVAKVHQKARHFGEAWEEVVRLGFRAMGDDRFKALGAETIWADPEYHSTAELMDSLVKAKALGIPDEFLWSKWGASPQEIVRIKELQAEEEAKATAAAEATAARLAAAGAPPDPAADPTGKLVLATPTVAKAKVLVEP